MAEHNGDTIQPILVVCEEQVIRIPRSSETGSRRLQADKLPFCGALSKPLYQELWERISASEAGRYSG